MNRISHGKVALVVAAALLVGHGSLSAAANRLALMPVKRGVRAPEAISALEIALGFQLTELATVQSRDLTRTVLRRHRLRDVDAAPPDRLRQIADELEVDWLLSITIHDIPRHDVPDVSLSMRLIDGATGELAWTEFQGRSGLDSRKLLGLGAIDSVEILIPELVGRMLTDIPLRGDTGKKPARSPSDTELGQLGEIAIIPFSSSVELEAQEVADTATEATRAVLDRAGTALASPGCVREGMRGQKAYSWGQLTSAAREQIRRDCKADLLVTGSVERWELAGSGLEPEPIVGLALRVLDAESGRVLWMGAKEAGGWDRQALFGSGRVHSRGQLLDRMVTKLTKELTKDELFSQRNR